MIKKRSKRRLKKGIVKNTVLTKNWFVVSNFLGFPKYHTAKKCAGHTVLLPELFSYKVLKRS